MWNNSDFDAADWPKQSEVDILLVFCVNSYFDAADWPNKVTSC